MATAYSSEVAIGTYNRIRIKCDYSGTSATCTVQFRRTQAYSGYWYDNRATLNFNNTIKDAAYSYSGNVGTSWVNLVTVSGYTISTSGGTYSWQFTNPQGGVLGCSGTITIGSQGTAPSGLDVSVVDATWNSVTLDTVVADWGSGSNQERAGYLLEVPYVAGVDKYLEVHAGNETGTINMTINAATSDFEFSSVPFTVYGCHQYYTGLWANTSVDASRLQGPTFYTAPYQLDDLTYNGSTLEGGGTVTAELIAVTNIVHNDTSSHIGFEYRVSSDGGSTYGAWVESSTTVAVGSNATIAVASLSQGRAYTIEVRQFCVEAYSERHYSTTTTVSFTAEVYSKFYGSVNGKTKRITKLYGTTADIDKLPAFEGSSMAHGITWTYSGRTVTLNGTNDGAGNSAFYLVRNATLTLPAGTYYCPPTGNNALHMTFYDGSTYTRLDNSNNYKMTLSASKTYSTIYLEVSKGETGTTFTNYQYTPAIFCTTGTTVEIKKLYGSVNGKTKLIFGGSPTPTPTPEYTMKHYVKSIAAGYIDTGYKVGPSTSVEVEYCLDGSTFADGALLGARLAYNQDMLILWNNCKTSSGAEETRISTKAGNFDFNYSGTARFKWHTVNIATNGNVVVDGRVIGSVVRDSTTNTYSTILFGQQTAGVLDDARFYRGSVARCSFYENGVLAKNFLPAVRNSDSAVGFLETVSNTFYTNQGTGTWTTD